MARSLIGNYEEIQHQCHEGRVNVGARLITNFSFADGIVVNTEGEEEAGVLVDRLDTTTKRYHKVPQGTKWRSARTRQK